MFFSKILIDFGKNQQLSIQLPQPVPISRKFLGRWLKCKN